MDNWWSKAVFYQVYPRSFADTSGSGVGDLRGVTAHLPYLQNLGVDALWLSPFYPSGGVDAGYDVVDYCDVDPDFGTLTDFDALLASAHARDMRIIIDMVPNHSSNRHPLFVEALQGGPTRAFYHFEDGRVTNTTAGPPNNWKSVFGGPSWTQAPDGSGQWYYHLFAPEQPDFNWENPQVKEYFEGVLRFWLDRGVDGFRIDVSDALIKDRSWPNTPDGSPVIPKHAESPVHDIYRRFRRVMDEYPGAMAVLETGADEATVALFLRPDEMHQAFNFRFMKAPWDAGDVARGIQESLWAASAVGAPSTWVIENHDTTRAVTRYATGGAWVGEYVPVAEGLGRLADVPSPSPSSLSSSSPSSLSLLPSSPSLLPSSPSPDPGQIGRDRARAMALLLLALPGSAYIYQGQELGLPEVLNLPDDLRTDPGFLRSGGEVLGRDGCRVPLPWSGVERPFGFSPAGAAASKPTWLPQPANWASLTVEAQNEDEYSMLHLYKSMLQLRRSNMVLGGGDLGWVLTPEQSAKTQLLHIRLSLPLPTEAPTTKPRVADVADVADVAPVTEVEMLVNFGDAPVVLPEQEVLLASAPLRGGYLPANASVILAVASG